MMFTGYDGIEIYTDAVAIIRGALFPALIGISVLIFSWGFLKHVWSWEHELDRERGKKLMLFGVTAIFVLIVVYGVFTWVTGGLEQFVGSEADDNASESAASTTEEKVLE